MNINIVYAASMDTFAGAIVFLVCVASFLFFFVTFVVWVLDDSPLTFGQYLKMLWRESRKIAARLF